MNCERGGSSGPDARAHVLQNLRKKRSEVGAEEKFRKERHTTKVELVGKPKKCLGARRGWAAGTKVSNSAGGIVCPGALYSPTPRTDGITRTHSTSSGSWKGANIHQDPPVATSKMGQKLQERTLGHFHFLRDPQTNNCSLRIRDIRKKDGGMYLFRLERGPVVKFSFKYKTFSLNVTSLIQTPDIQVPATLESGCPGSLASSMPAACNWRKLLIFSCISDTPAHISEVTIIPQPWNHSIDVTLSRSHVTTEMTIQLNWLWGENQSLGYLELGHGFWADAPQNLSIDVFCRNNIAMRELLLSKAVMEGRCLQHLRTESPSCRA
ncbi:hypothetical protein HPG69_014005 [Diceros bicornis minor]|uniref:Uncharacterized protein n=1 Tax=Diceros bicornis minor TaxID=77932 RepID=A0A7J7EMQ3_DICBM|nr:hypothetical protein HPG69_014005 [Diceros bicornis minor]